MKKSVKSVQKSKLNFTINTAMTLCMSAIIGIGFLIKYTLVSGQERWEIYGQHVNLFWLGMDRHQWGLLHLTLGVVLMGLLVVHIVLHWKVVTKMYQRMIKQPFMKKIVALCFVLICALLILIPFFIKPDIKTSKKGRSHNVTLVTQASIR